MGAAALAAGLVAVSACSTAPKDSSAHHVDSAMILPPLAATHRVRSDQRFLMASIIDSPAPAYPAELVGVPRRPVTVCVEAVVDAHGEVTSTRALDLRGDCAGSAADARRPYLAAASSALRSWTFFAAAICTPSGPDGDCAAADASLLPVPTRMAYRFTFRHRGARPHVEFRSR